ncbi:hypothetical protein [Kribbella amoyensis]|uniref:hypothetical protein n=1 Tax=Kribbella amoyensis TaxID=996641 RepID=UPI0011A5C2B9|nr:hypothetical protein [Kribbella amoyensis]
MTALRFVMFGSVLAYQVATLVSVLAGRQGWLWFPVFALLSLPISALLTWTSGRACLAGQPVLVVDGTGVSLGRKHLAWQDIEAIEGPDRPSRQASDPRRPTDATRDWFASVTVVPTGSRRKQQIAVGNEYAKDINALASWLDAVHAAQLAGGREA